MKEALYILPISQKFFRHISAVFITLLLICFSVLILLNWRIETLNTEIGQLNEKYYFSALTEEESSIYESLNEKQNKIPRDSREILFLSMLVLLLLWFLTIYTLKEINAQTIKKLKRRKHIKVLIGKTEEAPPTLDSHHSGKEH